MFLQHQLLQNHEIIDETKLLTVCRLLKVGAVLDDSPSTNQAYYDGGADEEGQYEAVDRVPRGEPSPGCSTSICKVQEVECEELCHKGIFHRHEHGWPCDGWRDDSIHVSTITMVTPKAGIFHAPVDGAQE